MKKLSIIAMAFITLSLAACKPQLAGTYSAGPADPTGTSYTFDGGGKVNMKTAFGGLVEMRYEVDGKNIKVTSDVAPGSALVMTIIDDSTISAGGINLRKVN